MSRRPGPFLRRWMRLENLSIGDRLRLAFICILLLMFIGSGITFGYLQQVRERVEGLSSSERRLTAALEINTDLVTLLSRLRRAADSEDAGYFETEAQWLLSDFQAATGEKSQIVRDIVAANGREKLVLESVATIVDKLPDRVSNLIDLARAGDWIALHAQLTDEVDHNDDVVEALMEEADADVSRQQGRMFQDIRDTEHQATRAFILIALLGLLAAACLGLWVTRSITGPLSELTAGARALASGEFEQPVDIRGTNELADLAAAFNQTGSDLFRLYSELRRKNRDL